MAAGSEINLYSVGDVDLTALMNTVDLQRVTYQGLSLTNYDNTALPAIAAGSLVEVAGALFKFASEEAITGWAGVGVGAAYIKLVPAGTDPDTVTAEFTDTAPAWSDAKQGWYGTGGNANNKYVAGLYKVDAATYSKKYLFHSINKSNLNIKLYGDGGVSSYGYYFGDVTAGANLLLFEDSVKAEAGDTYAKVKEIVCPTTGIVTTKFDMKATFAGNQCRGKIYINGIAVGAEHANTTTTYQTKTDAAIAVIEDDLIQLYAHTQDPGDPVNVRNLRVYCNETVPPTMLRYFTTMGVS